MLRFIHFLKLKVTNNYRLFVFLAIALFIVELAFILPQRGMSPVYSVPYFSGATMLDLSKGWQFDLSEVQRLKDISGYEIYHYQFDGTPKDLKVNTLNNTGYLYVVFLAHYLFPFLGPIGSVVLLQLFFHAILSFMIVRLLKRETEKILFLFFYFLNPLVLYFAVFPFYYFWQVIPSAVFLYFYLYSGSKIPIFSFTIGIILALFAFWVRPTVLFLLIFIIIYTTYKFRTWIPIASIPVLVFLGLFWNSTLNMTKAYGPWHTAYIGLGAYPNPFEGLYNLSDDRGYDKYESITGHRISASIDGEYTTSIEIRQNYLETLKKVYLEAIEDHPELFVRNAVLNTLQGFSVGYINGGGFYKHILIAITGLFYILLLLYQKSYLELLTLLASLCSFTLFFPPIQGYYYGTILLLVVIFIKKVMPILISFLEKNG